MPRGSYLSDFEKAQISAYLKSGLSFREIATKINRSHVVVTNFANNPSNYGKNKTGGSKQKLSEREKRRIINCASNTMKSLSQIIEECQVNVSKSTISRLLKDSQTITAASTLPISQLQPSPTILASNNSRSRAVRKMQSSRSRNSTLNSSAAASGRTEASSEVMLRKRQESIYDIERNIIGYQMQMMTPMSTMPAYTMPPHTDAKMSTWLDTSSNNKITTSYSVSKRPVKRPAQDSPCVFYTTPPLITLTPTRTQDAKNANTITQKTQGSIVTKLRTAGSSKKIIVSKSNQSSEETILPDVSNNQHQLTPSEHLEIKKEIDIEDFLD